MGCVLHEFQNAFVLHCAGQLTLCILSVLPRTKEMFSHSLDVFQATFSDKGILTSCVGPFTLGVGMTLAGAVCASMDTLHSVFVIIRKKIK